MHLAQTAGKSLAIVIGLTGVIAGIVSCGGGASLNQTSAPVTKASLGKALFSDKSLSNPVGEACATCHNPANDFTDTRPGPTSPGAVKGLFGFRRAPSIRYAAYSPTFALTGGINGSAVGGQFWDGRAADLPTQAKGPLLNPIEMNNPTIAAVVKKVATGPEAAGMKKIYGPTVFNDDTTAFNDIVDAIAEYERQPEVSPFTSKYDAFLKGSVALTSAESAGLAVFNGRGNCFKCHVSTPLADGTPPLFTNFNYFNLGLPRNTNNPYYTIPTQFNPLGSAFVDNGLGVTTGRATDQGLFKVPSLRNVALRTAFFHNGGFTSMTQVLEFYNSRNFGQVFGVPEVGVNVDTTDLGALGLSPVDINNLIAFLSTLTDGYTATTP